MKPRYILYAILAFSAVVFSTAREKHWRKVWNQEMDEGSLLNEKLLELVILRENRRYAFKAPRWPIKKDPISGVFYYDATNALVVSNVSFLRPFKTNFIGEFEVLGDWDLSGAVTTLKAGSHPSNYTAYVECDNCLGKPLLTFPYGTRVNTKGRVCPLCGINALWSKQEMSSWHSMMTNGPYKAP